MVYIAITGMPMNKLSDKQLVENLQSGSTAAFDALFYRYHVKVYRFAQRLHISPADAEEVVQEAFCCIWQNRLKIDPEQKFSSYLFGIARNQAHTILRRKALFYHYLKILEKEPGNNNVSTDHHVNGKEMKELLGRHIELMPPRRKEIFCMSRFEELTYKQIAEKLQISENTVDTQMRHALDFLRNIFFEKK